MKSYIVHLTKCVKGSTVASSRIALYLSDLLKLPLLHEPEDFIDLDKEVDTIYLVNSMSAFSKILNELADLARGCRRVVFIQNDYTIYPPTQLRRVFIERDDIIVERWSTVPQLPEEWAKKKIWVKIPMKATHYVNWNMLTYDPLPLIPKNKCASDTSCLFYYGAYRKDREHLFKKYFEDAIYPIEISASSKAFSKFLDLNYEIEEVPVLKNLIGNIAHYGTTIYLEDAESNDIYCSPANRFYECLSAGIAILFDKSSIPTMSTAGYNIRPYVVDSQEDVKKMLPNWFNISKEQSEWRYDFRKILNCQIEKAYHHV